MASQPQSSTGAEVVNLLESMSSTMRSATGVWTDDVQELADTRGRFRVRASKGVHLVVPRDRINSETGLILRTEQSVLFVIPGATSGWSAPPTPTGSSTRRTRQRAAWTSTTFSRK